MQNPHPMQKRQENMNISMFSQIMMFIWNLIDYVIYFMQTGQLRIVFWLNQTFLLFSAWNINFTSDFIVVKNQECRKSSLF